MSPSAEPSVGLKIPDDKQYTYDPDKAKALLDQAGWIDDATVSVRTRMESSCACGTSIARNGDGGVNTDFIAAG